MTLFQRLSKNRNTPAYSNARRFRGILIILVLQAAGAIILGTFGLGGPGVLILFSAAFAANLLFDTKTGILLSSVSVAIVIIAGSLFLDGTIPLPVEEISVSSSASYWLASVITLIILIILITRLLLNAMKRVSETVNKQANQVQELEKEKLSLERQVVAYSADLKIRSSQYEIASQIAREISVETDLAKILNSAVNLIRDRFGFYHVGIFLNDPRNEYAVLRAATGEAGRQMLERGHSLRIGEVGMVGYVASRGEPRIALNVASDVVHYKNPLLPETRSEVALPLRVGRQTIGALDVQSVIENAFRQEDIHILQIIADQIAIAFEKARLVGDLQNSIVELEASQSVLTQKAWGAYLRNSRQKHEYHYQNAQLDSAATKSPQSIEALDSGRPVMSITSDNGNGETPQTVLALPIRLRDQVLGVVDLKFEAADISAGMVDLVQGIVDRMAVSLDSARLLEEIQIQAERERVVGEISAKVRAASDVDSVLRIAVQEIGQTLGASQVMVQLRKDS